MEKREATDTNIVEEVQELLRAYNSSEDTFSDTRDLVRNMMSKVDEMNKGTRRKELAAKLSIEQLREENCSLHEENDQLNSSLYALNQHVLEQNMLMEVKSERNRRLAKLLEDLLSGMDPAIRMLLEQVPRSVLTTSQSDQILSDNHQMILINLRRQLEECDKSISDQVFSLFMEALHKDDQMLSSSDVPNTMISDSRSRTDELLATVTSLQTDLSQEVTKSLSLNQEVEKLRMELKENDREIVRLSSRVCHEFALEQDLEFIKKRYLAFMNVVTAKHREELQQLPESSQPLDKRPTRVCPLCGKKLLKSSATSENACCSLTFAFMEMLGKYQSNVSNSTSIEAPVIHEDHHPTSNSKQVFKWLLLLWAVPLVFLFVYFCYTRIVNEYRMNL